MFIVTECGKPAVIPEVPCWRCNTFDSFSRASDYANNWLANGAYHRHNLTGPGVYEYNCWFDDNQKCYPITIEISVER